MDNPISTLSGLEDSLKDMDKLQERIRSKDPVKVFDSRKIHRDQGNCSDKGEEQVKDRDSTNQYRHYDHYNSDDLTSIETKKGTSVNATHENGRLIYYRNKVNISTIQKAVNPDAEGKTTVYEDISPTISNNSSTTGMSGGKAVHSTIIGEEITTRNNTSQITDSVVKIKTEVHDENIVGMDGGETYSCKIIGKKTVSEGNKQTVERSHLDIDGDPSAVLQPILLKAASGHDGDGGGGVSIKDTTIIISGTGGQSDDATKGLEQELVDTKHRLDKLEEREDTTGWQSDASSKEGNEETPNTEDLLQELEKKDDAMENNRSPADTMEDLERRLKDIEKTVAAMQNYLSTEVRNEQERSHSKDQNVSEVDSVDILAGTTVVCGAAIGFGVGSAIVAPLAIVGAMTVKAIGYILEFQACGRYSCLGKKVEDV